MFGLWIMYVAIILWLGAHLLESRILVKYILCLICIVLACVPIFFTHYNSIEIIYAFFDAPSIITILIALTFLAKTFVQDVGTLMHKQISIPLALQPITFLYYAVFGALLLLGTLNIVPWLDVYHFDPIFENLIVLGVIAVMIYSDMLMGIFLALASVALFFTDTHNILDNIFCPYLWVYSVGYTLFMSFISLRKYYEKRILV